MSQSRSQSRSDGWQVVAATADLTTPGGRALRVPSQALAQRISQEWDAYTTARAKASTAMVSPAKTAKQTTAKNIMQPGIMPQTIMPMYCIAVTALDRVATNRESAHQQLTQYAAHELFCHRADTPGELADKQQQVWQPWLDWLAARYGVHLLVHNGLMPAQQPQASLRQLAKAIADWDDFRLTGIAHLAHLGGSLVAALAVADGHKTGEEAFLASFLDELWQAQRWGGDAEAETRRQEIKQNMMQAGEFLALVNSP